MSVSNEGFNLLDMLAHQKLYNPSSEWVPNFVKNYLKKLNKISKSFQYF